jgi:hypothetical protein
VICWNEEEEDIPEARVEVARGSLSGLQSGLEEKFKMVTSRSEELFREKFTKVGVPDSFTVFLECF